MKILIIEDQDEKYRLLISEVQGAFSDAKVDSLRANTFSVATKLIYENRYDLILIDLMMPLRDGDTPEDVSEDILSVLELSEFNRGANAVALSGYNDLVASQQRRFAEAGIVLVGYDSADEQWKKHLASALSRIREQIVFDFVIICALEKERAAYRNTEAIVGELRNIRGLDCMLIQVGNLNGACIKLPRMGLVEASITATSAIELFQPRMICMSGICAGDPKNAKLGTLIIPDVCWEYQAGKWADGGFKVEHYDVTLRSHVRTTLSQMIANDPKGETYKGGLMEDPVRFESIVIAPLTTGSAVIASKDRIEQIGTQHRKMAGLDMEMYGVYKAAELSSKNPIYFGAKTVVDLADSAKGDKYHEYGSILSARFVVDAIVVLSTHP